MHKKYKEGEAGFWAMALMLAMIVQIIASI